MKERTFRMYCKNTNTNKFELVFEVDGTIVNKKIEDCFENVLFESSKFLSENCEKFEYDTRFDSFEVNLNYRFS